MDKLNQLTDRQYLFGALFVAANRLDTMLERELKMFDVTAKQWFLSIVLDHLFDSPPTIKEVAREMGSSHQNVKQLALKLERKGLLKLEKDPKDSRATRLILTESSAGFWGRIRQEGAGFTEALFSGIHEDDLQAARRVFRSLLNRLGELDRKDGEELPHGHEDAGQKT